MSHVPVVALIGRPNVGKSTLFNRLTRSRAAIVADVPGLTRDRHYGIARTDGRRFLVVDTGGFEPVARDGITAAMAQQTRRALVEADVVVFVVDGRDGLTPHDESIALELRRSTAAVVVVVNKTEGMPREQVVAEFHALGLGDPVAISAAHGEGVRDLAELVLSLSGPGLAGADDAAAGAAAAGEGEAGEVEAWAGEVEAGGRAERVPTTAAEAPGDLAPGDQAAGDQAVADQAAADQAAGDQAAGDGAPSGAQRAATRRVRIAVVGRPNVGKSTLINTLLGEERLIAFDAPGTTRDAVAVDFDRGGRSYTLIDTAGIRRRGKVSDTVEKFSVIKTMQAIEDAQVVVLMLDAREGVAEQDAHIAGFILESGRAVVVAINKWDGLDSHTREQVRAEFTRKLGFLRFARTHFVSALHGTGIAALMRSVDEAFRAATAKLPTPRLTRALHEAVERQPPPRRGPIRPKMRYAHQGGQNPPVIVVHGSALDAIADPYRRYLEGWFRDRFELIGTPLRVEFRSGANPYAQR